MGNKILYPALILILLPTTLWSQFYLPLNKEAAYVIESQLSDPMSVHAEIKGIALSDIAPHHEVVLPALSVDTCPLNYIKPFVDMYTSVKGNDGSNVALVGFTTYHRFNKFLSVQLHAGIQNGFYNTSFSRKIDSIMIVPDWGKVAFKRNEIFVLPVVCGNINYSPKKYLSLSLGYDKHFLGDGYRSLFLSDNAAPYPYARFNVQFWKLRYFFMLAYLRDIDNLSGNFALYDKYCVMHYLSIYATKRLGIGFFEAVVWQGRDKLRSRNIDAGYLNPVIFFRPVEYSMHSPDNASIGGSGRLKVGLQSLLYGQLYVDDLTVKQLFNNSGWWGNKYGIQLGAKSYNFWAVHSLFLQSEFNYVRPYTYAHSTSLMNYGTQLQPIAHPLGANFYEALVVGRYTYKRCIVSMLASFTKVGLDRSANQNFGQDIYKSNTHRASDFGVMLGQGTTHQYRVCALHMSYIIKPEWSLTSFISVQYMNDRAIGVPQVVRPTIVIGMRSLLYNSENFF